MNQQEMLLGSENPLVPYLADLHVLGHVLVLQDNTDKAKPIKDHTNYYIKSHLFLYLRLCRG